MAGLRAFASFLSPSKRNFNLLTIASLTLLVLLVASASGLQQEQKRWSGSRVKRSASFEDSHEAFKRQQAYNMWRKGKRSPGLSGGENGGPQTVAVDVDDLKRLLLSGGLYRKRSPYSQWRKGKRSSSWQPTWWGADEVFGKDSGEEEESSEEGGGQSYPYDHDLARRSSSGFKQWRKMG